MPRLELRSLIGIACGILVFLAIAGCQQARMTAISHEHQHTADLPVLVPLNTLDTLFIGLYRPELVAAFYKRNSGRLQWGDDEQAYVLGDSLIDFIKNVRYFGLLPQNYHLHELVFENSFWWKPGAMLRRDVLLTDAFFELADDLRSGRIGVQKDNDSARYVLLEKLLAGGNVRGTLESQQPAMKPYELLRLALTKTLGNLDSASRSLLLKGTTIDSLRSHRMVQTIEINLERWRQQDSNWDTRYIYVNIPSFMVYVVENNEVVLESRAIIGKPGNATPEFSSVVQCFVTYPYWHVPRKIATQEFLPVIQRDTTFLTRGNFDVLNRAGRVVDPTTIQWASFNRNNFPVILRQREGPDNSLGIVKFVFDNPYAVYIHDTNSPRLFRNKKRALSHGCIRMEKAVALAHYLVTGDVSGRSPLLDRYFEQKLRHTVELKEPIKVHIRYFSAAADSNGVVTLFDDIYGKDKALIDSIYNPSGKIVSGSKGVVTY